MARLVQGLRGHRDAADRRTAALAQQPKHRGGPSPSGRGTRQRAASGAGTKGRGDRGDGAELRPARLLLFRRPQPDLVPAPYSEAADLDQEKLRRGACPPCGPARRGIETYSAICRRESSFSRFARRPATIDCIWSTLSWRWATSSSSFILTSYSTSSRIWSLAAWRFWLSSTSTESMIASSDTAMVSRPKG